MKKSLVALLLVLFLGLSSVHAESTLQLLDQALIELETLERNNLDLNNLLIERESTIAEKEQSLKAIQVQCKSLELSLSYLESKSKLSKIVIVGLGIAVVVEGIVILVK